MKKIDVPAFQKRVGPYCLHLMVAAVGMQFVFLFCQHLFRFSSLVMTVLLFVVTTAVFLLTKDEAEDKEKNFGMYLFQASIGLLAMSFTTHFGVTFANWIDEKTPGKGMAIFSLNILVDVLIVMISFAVMKNDKRQETFRMLRDTSLIERLGLIENNTETELGDVVLCNNKETKKPVIWKFKDRFLHMLVLGPTGSGKTSQTIIPLINQDMQNLSAGITVIEPKGDLAEKVYAMAEHYGRKAVYFNPILPNCPIFNPLHGKEDEVIESIATTFKMLSPDSSQFFLDQNENLIRNALKVLKRLMGNKATLIELSRLIHNSGGMGRKMVTEFSRLNAETAEIAKENADIAAWFLNDYFNEKSKTYDNTSGVRSQVSKITSNKYLRRVLNPENGENDLDFEKHLAEGGVITISTAQGALRDLGKFLGYFIILQFQASVFRRPGNENTRRAHFLYIDEFQTYSNPGFADMLTQGRSYRVASHLATQNRALIGMGSGRDGKSFIELVSTNARNIVLYPGGNIEDARYYSMQFGEILEKTTQIGTTRQKFNPLKGIKPMNYDSESIREVEELKARFSPSDLIYKDFGEITYVLIENNSVKSPAVGEIEFIPKELNKKLDAMVEEFNETFMSKEEAPKEVVMEDVLNVEPVILMDEKEMNEFNGDNTLPGIEDGVFEEIVIDEEDTMEDISKQSSHRKFDDMQDQDYRHMHQNDSPYSHDDDLI
ncbi:type IV secretory system conjugative DNA transfer family protein [Psychrobacillus sp. FSL H8-0510]|uniref:type IV secretory system conjugative DNA transfer family protein n=1 Tax=Psychrobacillus sp. FSL H8-0510 TaxID=2921394 RepID=UPI0030FA8498